MAINAGATARDLDSPLRGLRYTLSAGQPDSPTVQLNGNTLEAAADGGLPSMNGIPIRPGRTTVPPASITFLAFPDAGNSTCR
jgi:heparanase 1